MTDIATERRIRLREEREIARPHRGRLEIVNGVLSAMICRLPAPRGDIGPILIERGAPVEGGASPTREAVIWR